MKEGQRIIRGFLAAAVLAAGLQFEKPTEAQTPPILGEQNNVLFVPYIAPFNQYGDSPIFPPSTPTPPEVFYDPPKITPIMETCVDGAKMPNMLVELSSAEDTRFPPLGYKYFAISPTREGLSDDKREYIVFNTNNFRRITITPQLAGTYIPDIPTPPAQPDKTYVIANGTTGPNGLQKYDENEAKEFTWPGCPPKPQ